MNYYRGAHHETSQPDCKTQYQRVAGDSPAGGKRRGAPEHFAFMTEQYRYRDETIVLNPGDAIFQYTDGVTEATTAELELFGEERLLDAVNGAPSARPAELLPHVRAKIDAFVKGAAQFDDITMLGLRYNGESTGQEKSI